LILETQGTLEAAHAAGVSVVGLNADLLVPHGAETEP